MAGRAGQGREDMVWAVSAEHSRAGHGMVRRDDLLASSTAVDKYKHSYPSI